MRGRRYLLAVLAVAVALSAAGCSSGEAKSGTGGSQAAGPIVLTVAGEKRTVEYSMAQLRSLPSVSGYAGMKSSVGVITAPERYTGVPLGSLAAAVGGLGASQGVTVLAKDGYGMTFSHEQVNGTGFTTFDPATSAERPPADKLTMLIAYEREGKALPSDEGPLRLVVAEAQPDVVIDGHWSVKLVDRIEIKRAMGEWSASVEGKTSSTITRASYVSCASPGCHGSGWVDPQGHRWEGIPLWLVVGSVDDGRTHGAGAFNRKLALRGYSVELIGSTGAKAFLDSRFVMKHKNVLLAAKVDGGDLPPQDFPLRLVGPGLTDDEQVGRIAKVLLRMR
jgi:DMSO/TMAO reductase YedYZ molybdopterin-dependent catalytic subunit